MLNIKELRKEKKCTQLDVAEHLKIARTTFSAYEQGQNEPDIETLKKLADYFCVSVDYLIGHECKNNLQLSSLNC